MVNLRNPQSASSLRENSWTQETWFSYLYCILKLKEVPCKDRGSIGTFHLLVELFVLSLSSDFVISSLDLGTLQTTGISLISFVELYTKFQQKVFGPRVT